MPSLSVPLFAALDYAAIELRVVADLSGDERLTSTLLSPDGDPHMDTASVVFGIAKPTGDQRRVAKIVNFGIVYDVGPSGLHAQMETATPGVWSLEQCADMIETHAREHPGIVRYKAEKRLEARRHGFVRDPWGFRLHVPEVYAHAEYVRAEGERKAINYPVQRGAQTIIRRAMGAVYAYLRTAGLLGAVRPILQVHDELLFEFDSEEVANAQLPVIQALMEGTTALPSGIPIRVTVKRGFSLGAMEEDDG